MASAESAIAQIAGHAPELMTEALAETPKGSIAINANLDRIAEGKTVIAMGPGLGRDPGIKELVQSAVSGYARPMVLDADSLMPQAFTAARRRPRSRAHSPSRRNGPSHRAGPLPKSRRIVSALPARYAGEHGVTVVLKGQRTVIAFSDGRVWINPTGTPALGTGGTGDILTGMISGFLAQFPDRPEQSVAAAVYLGGLAAEIGARELGEKCFVATDILKYLPRAMEACAGVPDRV